MKEKHFIQNSLKAVIAFLFAALMSIGFTACSNNDDNPATNHQDGWSPAEKAFASSVIGVWSNYDDNQELLQPYYILYDIQEGGVFNYYMLWNTGNPDADYAELKIPCKWKPVLNIEDRWANDGLLNGIEVTIDLKDIYLEGTVTDTLLFVTSSDNERVTIWISDLDHAVEYYNSLPEEQRTEYEQASAKTRGFWGWLGQRFINIGKDIINIGKIIAQPVNMIIRKIQGKDARYASGLADWMGSIYSGRDPKVCNMSIPGTHDTFTFSVHWYSLIPTMTRKVRTQGLNIHSQWDAGIRCFDVRIGKHGDNELGICHGPFYLGVLFEEALESIAKEVKEHKGEMAIVILKFEEDVNETQYKAVYDKIEEYRKSGLVVDNPSADMRLSQCKGKMLFIQRYSNNKYNLDVRATGWNEKSSLIFMNDENKKAPLYVQDLYESNGDELFYSFIDRKEKAMTACFEASAKSTDNTWFFNHGSAYHGMAVGWDWTKYADMNYAEVAHEMNPWAADYVKEHYGDKTGVVVMDFGGIDELADGNYFTRGIDLPNYVVENNKHLE